MPRLLLFLVVCVAGLSVVLSPVPQRLKIFGITRSQIQNLHGDSPYILDDTIYAEDLHYHESSGLLFTASEANAEQRSLWFPPLAICRSTNGLTMGAIVVIDPRSSRATRLKMRNFEGVFNTHGIDIWSDGEFGSPVYIFAVNHVPNPDYVAGNGAKQTRPRIEVFEYLPGQDFVTHLRSVWHPLIRTPNDILAVSATEFYVTNDHFYVDGFRRALEDFGVPGFSKHTDLIHVSLSSLKSVDDSAELTALVAIKGIHNNNGLGRGANKEEILIGRAAAGVLTIAKRSDLEGHLEVTEEIQLDSTIDNPDYFHDPYIKETGRDASGYVLAGLLSAYKFPDKGGVDPMVVWLVQRNSTSGVASSKAIFRDDGRLLSTASTAVLVAIDPKTNSGQKQAMLYVTGPLTSGVLQTKIDL